ncbi:MAG TPA: histidinol-phosphate transaminase [Gammaproteobacteria bacterium]|nr:histidinol-phosphate transaminase [Gammaproteobacteria bacterium]
MSCDFLLRANPGVRSLQPYEPGKPESELARELGVQRIIKLASNENPSGPSQSVLHTIQDQASRIHRYPDGNGFELKAALAEIYGLDQAQITLGNGSNDILQLLANAFLGPGDEVIFSQHSFAVYPIVTQAAGATAKVIPAKNYEADLGAHLAAITDHTKMIFLANPNNPTGTWIWARELKEFISAVPQHVLVVIDEAYAEYILDDKMASALSWLSEFPNLIVTRTFSKAYGLAGLRVGYGVCHIQVADLLNRVRQPFNVNSLAQAAALTALEDQEYLIDSVQLNNQGMALIEGKLKQLDLNWIPSKANFLCIEVNQPGRELYQKLLRQGVIVRPIEVYELPNHIRVSIGTQEENELFLVALEKALVAN